MLRALTFDYWDTLFHGATRPERVALRQAAVRRLLDELGLDLPDQRFVELYKASGAEAERWWREEHRGYTTADRIRWLLGRLEIDRPEDCAHIARACEAVDAALLTLPPPLLPGAAAGVRRLARRFRLGIISDTGFASGRAQDRLLEREGLRELFAVTVYSMDVGHAKPRPEPFRAALAALGARPDEVLHIGDIERTDIRGALDAGMRAVRLDLITSSGPSAAEFVASTYEELVEYLEAEAADARA